MVPTVLRNKPGEGSVIIWQSHALNGVLQSVLVVPLTTNLDRARLAGTAIISATPDGPPADSVALAFQKCAPFLRPRSTVGFAP